MMLLATNGTQLPPVYSDSYDSYSDDPDLYGDAIYDSLDSIEPPATRNRGKRQQQMTSDRRQENYQQRTYAYEHHRDRRASLAARIAHAWDENERTHAIARPHDTLPLAEVVTLLGVPLREFDASTAIHAAGAA